MLHCQKRIIWQSHPVCLQCQLHDLIQYTSKYMLVNSNSNLSNWECSAPMWNSAKPLFLRHRGEAWTSAISPAWLLSTWCIIWKNDDYKQRINSGVFRAYMGHQMQFSAYTACKIHNVWIKQKNAYYMYGSHNSFFISHQGYQWVGLIGQHKLTFQC
jgi:hypothetical protein